MKQTCMVAALLLTAQVAMAQSDGGVSQNRSMRLITLGTRAGPLISVGRAQASNLLIVNGTAYVIDAGQGVTRRLARLGTRFRDIGTVFITHPHSDHTGGLGGLMSAIYDVSRTEAVNIYGPPGTAASVQALVQFLNVSGEIRMSEGVRSVLPDKVFHGQDTGVGTIFQDANVKVTAVENTHFQFRPGTPAYGKYKSYSYRFDSPTRSIVFAGDTGYSDAIVALARNADMLVSEVLDLDEFLEVNKVRIKAMPPAVQQAFIRHQREEHVGPEQIGKMAALANVKAVVITHIGATADPSDDYARYAEKVSKSFSGRVLIAKDLMEF